MNKLLSKSNLMILAQSLLLSFLFFNSCSKDLSDKVTSDTTGYVDLSKNHSIDSLKNANQQFKAFCSFGKINFKESVLVDVQEGKKTYEIPYAFEGGDFWMTTKTMGRNGKDFPDEVLKFLYPKEVQKQFPLSSRLLLTIDKNENVDHFEKVHIFKYTTDLTNSETLKDPRKFNSKTISNTFTGHIVKTELNNKYINDFGYIDGKTVVWNVDEDKYKNPSQTYEDFMKPASLKIRDCGGYYEVYYEWQCWDEYQWDPWLNRMAFTRVCMKNYLTRYVSIPCPNLDPILTGGGPIGNSGTNTGGNTGSNTGGNTGNSGSYGTNGEGEINGPCDIDGVKSKLTTFCDVIWGPVTNYTSPCKMVVSTTAVCSDFSFDYYVSPSGCDLGVDKTVGYTKAVYQNGVSTLKRRSFSIFVSEAGTVKQSVGSVVTATTSYTGNVYVPYEWRAK